MIEFGNAVFPLKYGFKFIISVIVVYFHLNLV